MDDGRTHLAAPPTDPRAYELWLQHVAGKILFDCVRDRALDEVEADLDVVRRAAEEALYGLMMVADGESGSLRNDADRVEVTLTVRHVRDEGGEERVVTELDLADGDGMCMGFHGWRGGDFGDDPVVVEPAQD